MKKTGEAGGTFNTRKWKPWGRDWNKNQKKFKKQEKLLKEFQILKKIEKVKELLEQDKKMDGTQQHMGHLQGVVETGKAT